jgi:hypothetical protein
VGNQKVACLGKIRVMLPAVSETAIWMPPDEGERLGSWARAGPLEAGLSG